MESLDVSPFDFLHLGSDGVLRVYDNATLAVHDAARLAPAQIEEYFVMGPASERDDVSHFAGVDGQAVPEEALLFPSPRVVAEAAKEHAKAEAALTSPVSNVLERRAGPFQCSFIICQSSGVCIANSCLYCSGSTCRVPF
jgi:hypothetical protein